MRVVLTLILLASPAALAAQIAPKQDPASPPGPIQIRTEGASSGTYENEVARDRIRDGRKSGALTRQQGRRLRREAGVNDSLAARYRRDGLSDSEQRELDMRGRALQSLTEAERTRPKRP